MDELNNYIPKIEFIFNTWMINSDDLFVKMPVQEIYNQYKNYLIDIFINNGLGYFNEIYDAIILNITDYYVNKQLEEMDHYEKMINEYCEVIINKDTYNNMYVHTKKIIKK